MTGTINGKKFSISMPKLRVSRAKICAKVAQKFGRASETVKLQFKDKYESNDFELFGGRQLIEEFVTNFGMRFEDTRSGQLYVHVLDI